jgi:hypothetical protein
MDGVPALSRSTTWIAVAAWTLLLLSAGCRPGVVIQPLSPATHQPTEQTAVAPTLVEVDIEVRPLEEEENEIVELTLVWGSPGGPKTRHVLGDESAGCSLILPEEPEEPLDGIYMSCFYGGAGANYTVSHDADELVVNRVETSCAPDEEGYEYEPEGENSWRIPFPSNVRVQWPSQIVLVR